MMLAIVELRIWDLKVFCILKWTFLNHIEYILMGLLIIVLYYQIKKISHKKTQATGQPVIGRAFLTPEQHRVQTERMTEK